MPADSIKVHCGKCDAELGGESATLAEKRSPCPFCGSTGRMVKVEVSDSITVRGMLDLKAREPGGGRPFMEQRVGDDLHRKSGMWMKLRRLIDRRANRYVEHITNPTTGEVVRDVEEPLDQHRGHGNAKTSSGEE